MITPKMQTQMQKMHRTQAEETDSATAKEQRIEEIMADMSLKEKIGQMMMADFRFDDNGNPVTSINDSIASDISEYHLGGVIHFFRKYVRLRRHKTVYIRYAVQCRYADVDRYRRGRRYSFPVLTTAPSPMIQCCLQPT